MLRLHKNTVSLQAVLGGNITTNQLQATVSYIETPAINEKGIRGVTQTTNTNNTTDVTICAAPTQGAVRYIDIISIFNKDTVNATVTIKLDDSGTETILVRQVLAANETLFYNANSGWGII